MEVTPKLAYDALMVAIDTEMLILDKKDNLKMPKPNAKKKNRKKTRMMQSQL